LGVLVSGRGSNLQSIIDEIKAGRLAAEVRVVISNRPEAYALERARQGGIPVFVFEQANFPSRQKRDEAILACLIEHEVELVVMAGYDQLLDASLVRHFANRMINIHPSLLPAFAGTVAPQPQADALAYGVNIAGCTVHFVTEETDAGPIILQAAVPVLDDDTPQSLAARILEQEHRILPEAIALLAANRLDIVGRRVFIKPEP